MSFELYRTKLLKSLHNLKGSMDRFLESFAQNEGLTALQTMLLLLISEGLVTNVSSLCRELGITQSNASALCKKLEKDGFLIRQRNAEDERVVNLILTEKGTQTLERIHAELKKQDFYFDQISDAHYQMLLSAFDELSACFAKLSSETSDHSEK